MVLEQSASVNFAASYKEWNYGTFAEGATYSRLGGHHVGHRPVFYTLSILPNKTANIIKLECGPMPNVMAVLPNIGVVAPSVQRRKVWLMPTSPLYQSAVE